jgi:hypothetical protein
MNQELKDKELKIFRKVLIDHSFDKDGYEYHFLSIDKVPGGWAYDIIVNVVLPEKGQSYATPVFSKHIHDILSNIWKYVGTSFSYSEKILVNGKEPINNGVFISTEKQREVLSAIRREIKEAKVWTAIGWLTFDVNWRPMKNFYELDDVYIDFNFNIQISNFKLDGRYVKPNLNIADDVAGAILNVMYDSDTLRDDINNVIYDTMSDEIDIIDVDDLYYQGRFFIDKMDGFEINQTWGNHYDLEDGMFT